MNKITPIGRSTADDADALDDGDAEPIDDQLVAASEADLITMARTLLAPQTHDAWSALCRSRKLPDKIGETAEYVLEETLRQTWPALWRRGGTQPRQGLDGKRGRGWQRAAAPAELAFSAATMHLLRWLVAQPLGAPASTLDRLGPQPLAIGDQVLVYLALDAAASTPAITGIARQPFVRACPLAWLGFAHLFDEAPGDKVDFATLTTGPGAHVVAALGDELARRWFQVELGKRQLTSPDAATALGAAQDATLTRFMAACDQARRRDLAGWIVEAARPSLERNIAPLPAQLDPSTTLSARLAGRVACGALLRALVAWSRWDQEHRGVRFIDDDYAAAQVMLAGFEKIGAAGVERAELWLSDLAALTPSGATANATGESDATVTTPGG